MSDTHRSEKLTAAYIDPVTVEWFVGETQDDYPVVFIEKVLDNGEPYAHVLFQGDWGELEHAEHIAKLHNDWLAERKEAGLV
jgi:hypothetical protein